MNLRLPFLVALLAAPALACAAPHLTVHALPESAWIERGRALQRVHFDFRFESESPDSFELAFAEVSALDPSGALLARRFIGANGTAPSILTVPARVVTSAQPLLVFNPFPEWDEALPLARLRYQFRFESGASTETLFCEVVPREFRQHAVLRFPLAGRVLVFDAHDALAHHRRLDTTHPVIARLGVARNSGRYAYDLSLVDEQGSMYRGDGSRNQDWYSWNAPVEAPAAGRVALAVDGRADYEVGKTELPMEEILADPATLFGNAVVIDHGNGEFSMLAHLRKGSVAVKVGDRVAAGQVIGHVGYSGSVFTVHLHYELRTGTGLAVEGLPSRFSGLARWLGAKRAEVRDGFIDTGDIVERR